MTNKPIRLSRDEVNLIMNALDDQAKSVFSDESKLWAKLLRFKQKNYFNPDPLPEYLLIVNGVPILKFATKEAALYHYENNDFISKELDSVEITVVHYSSKDNYTIKVK